MKICVLIKKGALGTKIINKNRKRQKDIVLIWK